MAGAITDNPRLWRGSDTRNIATTLYSFALAERAIEQDSAFRLLATITSQRTSEFSVQGLTNAVWSYATASYAEVGWFAPVSAELLQRCLEEFEALDVANCLWSFAAVAFGRAGGDDTGQSGVKRLREIGMRLLPFFTAQNLAISMWSLAVLEVRDVSFFEQAADSLGKRLPDCKSQELNNALWACATASVRLPWLFIKVSNQALSIGLSDFKTHELSIMMWAHGMAGVCNHNFFDAVIEELLEHRGIESCSPREVANTAWAYSTIIGRCHVPWLRAVASFSTHRVREFDLQCIGNVVWAFASVLACSSSFFTAACLETAERCRALSSDFVAHNVAQVLSAAHAAGTAAAEQLMESATHCIVALDREAGALACRELVVVSNAVCGAAGKLPPDCWSSLERLVQRRVLDPLQSSMPASQQPEVFWEAMEACVSRLDIDHLGPYFTVNFLRESGAVAAVELHGPGALASSRPGLDSSWVGEAVRACAIERERVLTSLATNPSGAQNAKLSRQLDKVNKREIVAWLSYRVLVNGQPFNSSGRAFGWRPDFELQEGPSHQVIGRWLRSLVTNSRVAPNLIGEHNRSGHAERGALLTVANDWVSAAGLASADSDILAERVSGGLWLYVTHFPCISCSCVIVQFARLFPRVSLEVAFADGRSVGFKEL